MSNLTDIVNATSHTAVAQKLLFSWLDYTLFSSMLLLSALIGVYFGFFGKKQDTVSEYILGGKSMQIAPIAVSLVASLISGVTLLAVPADIYIYGASYWLAALSMICVGITTHFVYLPVYYKLQLTSIYEYLKIRFGKDVQMLASFLYTFSIVLYTPIVIYIPALAFSQVSGANIHMITPIVCIVCIFYTTLGGLKAVVWTDALQFIIMMGATVFVLYLGVNATGGLSEVFRIAHEGGRTNIYDFDPDPTNRTSFWSVFIGMYFSWVSYIVANQCCVQKFMSLPSYRNALIALICLVVGIVIVKSMTTLTGLIMYARYHDCDPFNAGIIDRPDQLLPHYVMDIAGHISGLPGVFIAGIFCAALSTMSAFLNTLAGTLYEDFISPFMPADTTEKRASNIMKLIVMVTGVFCTAMVFIVENLGNLMPLSLSIGGMINGPLLGMFSLGMLVPFANTKGTLWGAITGLLIISCIGFGTQYQKALGAIVTDPLPASVEGCGFNVTTQPSDEGFIPAFIFRISFYYYTLIGAAITMFVGIIASKLTGGSDQKVNKDLLSPAVYWALPKNEQYTYNCVEMMDKNLKNAKETEALS